MSGYKCDVLEPRHRNKVRGKHHSERREKSDFVYALVRKARIPKNIMILVLYTVEYTQCPAVGIRACSSSSLFRPLHSYGKSHRKLNVFENGEVSNIEKKAIAIFDELSGRFLKSQGEKGIF